MHGYLLVKACEYVILFGSPLPAAFSGVTVNTTPPHSLLEGVG